MATFYLWTLLGTACLSTSLSSAYTAKDATAIQAAILSNYSSKVRPSATTDVSVQFGMMHITDLNIVNQQVHIVGFLLAIWIDSRLVWTPNIYGDMNSTYMLLSDIWSPSLVLSNAADEIKMMNDDSDLSSMNVFVAYNGFTAWLAPANFMAQCTINIMYYPFDSQKCHFVVSTWLLPTSDLNIYGPDSSINTDLYEENGEWDFTSSTVENVTRILMGHHMPAVKFTTYLTRKYSYYLMNMILPVVILAIMAPFVFMLPVDSGEKIGYALTLLLSLSVVMTLVSDSIPPTSTHICVLSVYLLTTYIICSVETLVTVVTCRIHDFHLKGFKMGRTLQSFTRIIFKITKSTRGIDDPCKERSTQKQFSSSTSLDEIKMIGDRNVTNDIVKSKAWAENNQDIKEVEDDKEYSFEEFAIIFDKFNFFAFTAVTISVTVIFILVLRVGGAS